MVSADRLDRTTGRYRSTCQPKFVFRGSALGSVFALGFGIAQITIELLQFLEVHPAELRRDLAKQCHDVRIADVMWFRRGPQTGSASDRHNRSSRQSIRRPWSHDSRSFSVSADRLAEISVSRSPRASASRSDSVKISTPTTWRVFGWDYTSIRSRDRHDQRFSPSSR